MLRNMLRRFCETLDQPATFTHVVAMVPSMRWSMGLLIVRMLILG